MRSLLLIWIAPLLAACGGTTPSTEAPPDVGAAATTAEGATTAPTPTASATATPFGGSATSAAQGPPPTAKVIAATPSKESAMYLHVEILFDNPATRACQIDGYVLTWPGGKKTISLDGFSVPSHEQKKRSVKVHPDDGDLKSLTPSDAAVSLSTDCAVP